MTIDNFPHSLQAEQAVIGAMLIDNNAIDNTMKGLNCEDFYTREHQLIYSEVLNHYKNFGKVDVLTLTDHLKTINKLIEIGGEAYLFELAKNTPSTANIDAYAKVVSERAKQRNMAKILSNTIDSLDTGKPLPDLIRETTKQLNKIEASYINANQLTVLTLPEFLAADLPQMELQLDPWLPKQGLAMIFAPRGIGKTHVALNVAYAVASGGEFLGWQANKPRGVLYIDGEMSASAMQERLAGIVKSHSKQADSDKFKFITPDMQQRVMPDLSTVEGQQLIERHLDNVDLIVIDNISTLCRSSKENEAEGWMPIQDWALRMRASGRSVLFIHHAAKNGAQRGTSKREDVLDSVISLELPQDHNPEDGAMFNIHFKKSRGFFGDKAQSLQARLSTDNDNNQTWHVQTVEKSTFDKVVELSLEGFKQHEIANKLDVHKSTISRHMQRAKDEGLL